MGALRSGSRMLQHGPEEVGHRKWDEEASRVEIVLARVVHDSQGRFPSEAAVVLARTIGIQRRSISVSFGKRTFAREAYLSSALR